MKNITPIQFTSEEVMSEVLKVTIIEDDLSTYAKFSWWLFTAEMAYVDTGIVRCEDVDYTNWSGDNNYPYTFVANVLNLTLV